jgi:hypothetical protein
LFTALLAALLQVAPTQCTPQSPGAVGDIETIRVFAGQSAQQLVELVRAQGTQPNDCFVYREVPPGASDIRVELTANRPMALRSPASVENAVAESRADGRIWVITLRAVAVQTIRIPLVLQFQANGPNDTPSSSAQVELYLARRPEISLVTANDCDVATLSLTSGGSSTVRLKGTGLREIRTGDQRGRIKQDSTIVVAFPVELDGEQLLLRIPSSNQLATQGLRTLELETRQPYYERNGTAWTSATTVRLERLRIRVDPPSADELRFAEKPSGELTLFTGETVMAGLQPLRDSVHLKTGTYLLVDGAGDRRRNVATLDVTAPGKARVSALANTNLPFRKGGFPEILGYLAGQPDTPLFHTHLQVITPPRVERLTVRHELAAYDDATVRPLERVAVQLSGSTLSAFDTVVVASADGQLVSESPRSATEWNFVIRVGAAAQNAVRLLLRSSMVRDTILTINVVPAGRPRSLEFVTAIVRKKSPPRGQRTVIDSATPQPLNSLGRNFLTATGTNTQGNQQSRDKEPKSKKVPRELDTLRLDGNTIEHRAKNVRNVRILFNPTRIDSPVELFGPQYLVVDAGFYAPNGEEIARDSARIVVVPQAGFGYSIAQGFANKTDVLVEDMLRRRTRYATPGSYVQVNVRHDAAQYGNKQGQSTTLRVIDDSRFRMTPRLDLLTGLTYFAEVPTDKTSRTPLASGSTADTLVRRSRTSDWKIDFFNVAGGASAAIDFDWLNSKFEPRPYARIRLALLAVADPFATEQKRRFGLALLYPIEVLDIKGGIQLSLAAGYGRLLGGKDFGVITPGVGFKIPGL